MTYRDLEGTQSNSFYLGGENEIGIKINNGKLQGTDNTYPWEDILGKAPFEINLDTKEPTGFVNRTDSIISFNSSNRTFSIQPVSTSYDVYHKGTKITKTTTDSIVIDNQPGLHYLYLDNNGVLNKSQNADDFKYSIQIAIVNYCPVHLMWLLMEERHGITMDCDTHIYLHSSIGTASLGGFDLSGYTLDNDTDSSVTIGISDGKIADEDIIINIKHSDNPINHFEQILQDSAQIPVFYLEGSDLHWHWDTPNNFYFKNTLNGNVNYNYFNNTDWIQKETSNNYYVAYWIFATNSVINPIISIQGQREDNSLSNAVNNNKYEQLTYGGLINSEMKILYRIILQTGYSFNGSRKAKLVHIEDLRGNTYQRPDIYKPLYHCALQGKDSWAHPLSSIYTNNINYSGFLLDYSNKGDVLLSDLLNNIDNYSSDRRVNLSNILKTGGNKNSFINNCFKWEDDFVINLIDKSYSNDGYFKITMPVKNTTINKNNGTFTTVTSDGIPLNTGDILFYKLPYKTDSLTKNSNFLIVNNSDTNINLTKDYIPLVIRTFNGDIDIPNKSRFKVYCESDNTNQITINKDIWTKIVFNNTTDNCMSMVDGCYTSHRDGHFLISCNLSLSGISSTGISLGLYKNNSEMEMIDTGSISRLTFNKLRKIYTNECYLDKHDTIEVYINTSKDCVILPSDAMLKILSLDH